MSNDHSTITAIVVAMRLIEEVEAVLIMDFEIPLMTENEAADFLCINVKWLRRQRKNQEDFSSVPFILIGNEVRYLKSDLETYVEGCRKYSLVPTVRIPRRPAEYMAMMRIALNAKKIETEKRKRIHKTSEEQDISRKMRMVDGAAASEWLK